MSREEVDFDRAHQIFNDLLEAAEEERDALLDRLCGDDAALAEEVRELLAADSESVSWLDAPRPGQWLDRDSDGDGLLDVLDVPGCNPDASGRVRLNSRGIQTSTVPIS